MWEKTREDGTRKLRHTAIPTIFSFSKPAKLRKPPLPRTLEIVSKKENLPIQPSTSTENISDLQPGTSREYELGLQSSPSHSITSEETILSSLSVQKAEHSAELLAKLEKYKKMFFRERTKVKHCKNMLRKTNRTFKNVVSTDSNYLLLRRVFNQDQISVLRKGRAKKSTKVTNWSNETITKSLKLKFSCGKNGYHELLRQNVPLPSIRTLQRRLQNLKFDSGVLHEVFQFLSIKVQTFGEHERDCVLVLDEMSITPGTVFDSSLNKYFGNVTLPEHTGIATHVLVFMLGGITTRWKQVVAYHFTGDSVNGVVFESIIRCIFQKVADLNLNILSITSDMGPCNQALWKSWGISAGKYTSVKCKIPHPLQLNESVYIFADVPHLFKNIKAMLINNKIITLPQQIVKKYNLPTNEILSSHLSEIIAHQESNEFKLAPKLSEEDLLPTHFSKMKVSTSTNVVNHSVSSALKFLSYVLNKPAYLTTAWFLDQVEKWFYIMTSRHPSNALSKFNLVSYNETVTFLEDFKFIFANLEVGYKKLWKPSQTGVLISTQSILELHTNLLDSKGYGFLLTSRFSQDCLENLFSVLRSKQIVPNALQVKNNLKLICVSQYLLNPTNSSYNEDDRAFLSGFLDTVEKNEPHYDPIQLPEIIQETPFQLNYSELNSLYNICGYLLQSIIKNSTTCPVCVNAAGSKTPIIRSFTKFTMLKRFREKSLFFCNESLFNSFLEMESVFKKYISFVINQNINLKEFFVQKMSDLEMCVPDCHKLKNKIIKRFVVFRLKIYSRKCKTLSKKHSSKSVAASFL